MMGKPNFRTAINLSKQKSPFESRLTDYSSTLKSKNSCPTSNPSSTSSSMANISLNFMKDSNFPKLFNNSPMLFSFNGQPQTTKNSSLRSSIGFSSGYNSSSIRTPSSSSYSSLNQFFEKDHLRKSSLFTKKSSELAIDLSKNPKIADKTHSRTPTRSLAKQNKSHNHNHTNTISSLSNPIEYASQPISYDSVTSLMANKQQTIRVFVRIKPSQNRDICVKPYILRMDDKHLDIQGKIVAYDHVFAVESQQEQVFDRIARPVLEGLFDGYNGTIFAYGQTGSGKTHTIFGGNTKQSQGIISRSIKYIFSNTKSDNKVSISLLEIYKQDLIDLLNETKTDLKIKQTIAGVSVQGLTRLEIRNVQQSLKTIENSLKNRRVAATKINQKSSRSHTILTVHIESMQQESRLCLIDLAGSEKANKAGVSGQNFEEMKKINYSLSCLGNVINALVTRKKSDHIPFRDSKLTRLLKDSLSGKFRTSIIVNCSSDVGTQDQTISSLKFADRAKKVKITITKTQAKGKQNVEYLQKVIQQLTTDLQNTKRQLTKYKQICKPDEPTKESNQPAHPVEVELTTRQTIPSQRAHLDQQMKKYGKENRKINVVSICHKQKSKLSVNFSGSELSSLNVSKSTINFYPDIGSPSVSSLSYRPDDCIDDLSFQFSHNKEDFSLDKNC